MSLHISLKTSISPFSHSVQCGVVYLFVIFFGELTSFCQVSLEIFNSRGTMTDNHPSTKKIHPTQKSPWKDKWNNMTQFEKICWYWDVENRYLNKNIKKTLQFEKLISSYKYFKEHLLDPLELKISKETWQKEVEKISLMRYNVVEEHC
ncbi:hypothetical protein ES703_103408 [subsurface metagenome]